MKKLISSLILLLIVASISAQKDFSFVFITDIHMRPDSAVEVNFEQVISQINKLHPDFVISGGDMINTAKNVNEKEAKALFDLVDTKLSKLDMPLFYTLGNHELVGVLPESGMESSNPMWGKGMYEKRYAKRYYSFMHLNWKFFILDGFQINEKERRYVNKIDSTQIKWLKNELLLTDKSTPIIIVIHSSLINPLAMTLSKEQALSENSETVMDLFKGYNLHMVLQGHNHVYMNLFIGGIHYISGGTPNQSATSNSFNVGFVFAKVRDNTEEIQFIKTGKILPSASIKVTGLSAQ